MKTRNFSGYTIGHDAYEKIGDICKKYGEKIVFIGGKTALEVAGFKVEDIIKNQGFKILGKIWFGGEASYENVEILMKNQTVLNADMIFVFGGGKACDTCKVLTDKLKKPLFVFPTIASTCAASTKVCAMYYSNGEFKDMYFRYAPPEHIFINTQIIAEAPIKYLWAGIGDTIAKGYEPEFSSRNKILDYSNSMGVQLSKLCVKNLIANGEAALISCEKKVTSSNLEETILTIIITTGLVSNFLITDYNGALAHAICYAFTSFKEIEEKYLHGEMVSYGVLVQLILDNQQELENILPFYKKIKLPISMSHFNIKENEIDILAEKAVVAKDVRVTAYPIEKDMIINAIKRLENFTTSI